MVALGSAGAHRGYSVPAPSADVTRLLAQLAGGDTTALTQLLPLVYDELRSLAARALRRERRDHTLSATALVHESFLKLVEQRNTDWRHRAQFLAVASQLMRRVLIDHARARATAKRGGGQRRILLEYEQAIAPHSTVDLEALDEALQRLARIDAQQTQIVELRLFGGLNIDEIAAVVGVSEATVKRDWALAKAWLHRELTR